jgi:hypothetical protein
MVRKVSQFLGALLAKLKPQQGILLGRRQYGLWHLGIV